MWFTASVLVIVLVVVVAREWLRKRGRRWRQLSQFPGDPPLPLIGNALELGFDADGATDKLLEIWKRNGKTSFRMTLGSEDWVMLCEPDHIAAIMGSVTEIVKSPERNAAVKPFFGNSVSSSDGDRWRLFRKLMVPSFALQTLPTRLDTVNHHCAQLVEILNTIEGSEDVSMYKYLRPYMFDVLSDTLFGVETNLMRNPDHPYIQDSEKIVSLITENYFSYWRNIRPLFALTSTYREMLKIIQTIRDTSQDIITQRKTKLGIVKIESSDDNNNNADIKNLMIVQPEEHCLLDTLLLKRFPNGDPIPEEIIMEEISFVCFTGHFTTSMTISHTLYCLAKYPEIQQRVLEEQRSIFHDDYLRKPTMQDINEMKYLEAVIKETIRLIPTVPKIGRKLKNDLALKDGRIIPSGSTVIVYSEALFRNEKSFPEPDKFDPERFYLNDANNMNMYAYMPFGGGPRTCLGFRLAWVAMKASLSSILRRFEISPGEAGAEPQFGYRIVTESKNGIHLKIKKRLLVTTIEKLG